MKIWSWTAAYLSIDGIDRDDLRGLAEHWRAVSRDLGGAVPPPDAIDIHQFESMFAHFALVDVTDVEHPRYAVVGANLIALLGRDPTGRRLEAIYRPRIVEEIRTCFRRAVSERQPLFYRREFQLFGRSLGYDRLVLPLAGPDGIDRLLVAIYPLDKALTRASQWQGLTRRLDEQEALDLKFAGLWAADVGARAEPVAGVSHEVLQLTEPERPTR